MAFEAARGDIAKRYATIVGAIFLIVGVLGFVPALTPGGDLFGLFAVNAGHNWVHILSGLLGLWAGASDMPRTGLWYAWYVLIAYGLVTLLGFFAGPTNGFVRILGFIHINQADNILHLLLALSALAVVIAVQRRPVLRA